MSDTPRTDAAEFIVLGMDDEHGEPIKHRVVYSEDARQLEREVAELRNKLAVAKEGFRALEGLRASEREATIEECAEHLEATLRPAFISAAAAIRALKASKPSSP